MGRLRDRTRPRPAKLIKIDYKPMLTRLDLRGRDTRHLDARLAPIRDEIRRLILSSVLDPCGSEIVLRRTRPDDIQDGLLEVDEQLGRRRQMQVSAAASRPSISLATAAAVAVAAVDG